MTTPSKSHMTLVIILIVSGRFYVVPYLFKFHGQGLTDSGVMMGDWGRPFPPWGYLMSKKPRLVRVKDSFANLSFAEINKLLTELYYLYQNNPKRLRD